MSIGNTLAHAVRCALSERSSRPGAARLSGILLLAAATSFGAQSVLADPEPQETQQGGARNAAAPVQEVIVVGSRIRRDTFNASSPVQVIDRNETTLAGFATTADVLQSTAVTGGSAQINNQFGGFVTNGGPGANTLSLRGLGPERTLILINGRRIAPSGTRGSVGSVDLNVLPSAILDRTEILKDGASSVYGSDAIAGVVNLTTRKDIDGIEVESSFSYPEIDAGQETQIALVAGVSRDRWRVSGSLEFNERQAVVEGDRAFSRCGPDLLRDPATNQSLDFVDPTTGQPKCRTISGTGQAGVTVNTIGTNTVTPGNAAGLGLTGAPVGAAGSSVTGFNRFRPNPNVATGVVGFEGVGGAGEDLNVRDTSSPDMLNQTLLSPVRNLNAFVQGSYDLQALGNAEVFFEFFANERKSNQSGFRQLSLDYEKGSPLIPANLQFSTFGGPQLTSNGNDVGVRAFIGAGNLLNEQEVKFYKPTLGLRGDLPFIDGWRYETLVAYSKSDGDLRTQTFLTDKLSFASDVVTATGGVDPSLVRNGLTCRVNLTNPGERCVPFPELNAATIGGNLPADFMGYVARTVEGNTEFEERTATGLIDGPLFKLPYGEVKGVFGLEYRRQKLDDTPDPNSIAGNLFALTSSAVTKGKDTVREAFTEINVPVLAGLTGANALDVSGSYRYTDYNSFGNDTTYRYGVVYSPISEVSLRYNRGTSFRAPALFEQFQGATTGFLSQQQDPCNNFGNAANPNRQINCQADLPNENGGFMQTQGITVVNQGGAAAGLDAETSDNITYGIVVQPDLGSFGRLSIAVDYFDIEISNGVSQVGAGNILPRCYDDPQFRSGGGFCRLVTRNPNTAQLLVSDAFTNIANQGVKGIDYNLRYDIPVGPGNLVVNTLVTQFKTQPFQLFPDDDVTENNATIGSPKITGEVDLTYLIDRWTVRYGVEFVESTEGYSLVDEDPQTSIFDFRTGNYFTHNLSVRYGTDNWQATLGVRNLFDESPPSISVGAFNRQGTAPLYSGYDLDGREVFLRGAMQFGPKK
jgi:outer membrane receptor protein involved in Fe transport